MIVKIVHLILKVGDGLGEVGDGVGGVTEELLIHRLFVVCNR